MKNKSLPLEELSIAEIYNGDKATYEVPIYQRNYAWESDEISALIQDVYDAFVAKNKTYFIGTLVSFHKGDHVYEVIDGQQRLTTIYLVLGALRIFPRNKLTYRARKKSNDTIKAIPLFEIDEKDFGIVNGFKYAKNAIKEIVPELYQDDFKKYFQNNVHIIHYQVPKDIDLNHYFEIMNSRGEQLEKHEVIKARLIEQLSKAEDKEKFNRLWEFCSEMNVYIQQKYRDPSVFGDDHCNFIIDNFESLRAIDGCSKKNRIIDLIGITNYENTDKIPEKNIKIDTFQPVIDFTNFLLIVLKLTRIEEDDFKPTSINLDDKELIKEFDKLGTLNEKFVKKFGFNLLKAKFLLDNYIVHHSNEDDSIDSNPWKLQHWKKNGKNEYLINIDGESIEQYKLVQLLSMFEVSFTARQRKNYLFYCLLYLFGADNRKNINIHGYCDFLSALADKYFKDVYLDKNCLNNINTPNPSSFDSKILINKNILDVTSRNKYLNFNSIYGDGNTASEGIPFFVFNYIDYKLWEKYAVNIKGEETNKISPERVAFFRVLGCNDFGLEVFRDFYFSRTRRSLEHYYPQANVGTNESLDVPTESQINCLGNFAMIGNEMNSSGSNWSPKTKLEHYLDSSGKITKVSVASIKFMIMMQMCKDNAASRPGGMEWIFSDIKEHQKNMLQVILPV